MLFFQVWQLGSPTPNFTLEGHEKGVNCVDYYHGGDKPYLISGADDRLVKIWDYQNKTCVQTLEGHAANISAGSFSNLSPWKQLNLKSTVGTEFFLTFKNYQKADFNK